MIWHASAVALVSSAIERKYDGTPSTHVERAFEALLPVVDGASSEADLRAHLAAPDRPDQDIANQLLVLALIEKWWTRDGHPSIGIGEIHRALFGDGAVDSLREEDDISDFGGSTLIPWQEVGCRIDELEQVCRGLGDCMRSAPLPAKAQFLAHVFSAIIRIHPFPDGNGRTARMYVQYLLRRWGHAYIVIPKVRNDREWREALEQATGGDIPALQSQFERRMMRAEAAD